MNLGFRNTFLFIVLFGGLVLFSACPSVEDYPEIPQIEFKQVKLYDTIEEALNTKAKVYKLKFGLIDGDGDIGLYEDEMIGTSVDTVYKNNFLAIFYEIKNGDTIMVDSLNRYNYRIPYVEPQGQNKTLLADIYIDYMFFYDVNDQLLYDSVMFEFFVIDRKLNHSNIERTPVLSLNSIGEFPEIEND